MPQLFPANDKLSKRLKIVKPGSVLGSKEPVGKLGGRAPEGVVPTGSSSEMMYFATVPIWKNPDWSLTMFLARDSDKMLEQRSLLRHGGCVDLVAHSSGLPRQASPFSGDLSECDIVIEPETADSTVVNGRTRPESIHKLGGRPFLEHPSSRLRKEVEQILERGEQLIIQFGDCGGPSAVHGDWPFFGGTCHIFGKTHEPVTKWVWLLEV